MSWIGITVGLTVLLTVGSASALQVEPDLVVGDEHEIIVSYRTASQDSNGSSGSSQGSDTFLERVIALSDAGLELEFDLPSDATAEDRARVWQYPARVIQRPDGSMQLLNGPELDERVDQWLTRADLTREICGRWIFTWNAFRIECDPKSVVADLQAINLLTADLRDGAVYDHPGALGSAPLSRRADGEGGSTYSVRLDADVDAVRRSRAEGDVAKTETQTVTVERRPL